MMRHDLLVRTACRLALRLQPQRDGTAVSHDALELIDCLASLQRLQRLHRTASHRGWTHAARRVDEELRHVISRIPGYATRILSQPERPRPQNPSLGHLLEDLRQLMQEFDDVQFDLRAGRILATTSPITLQNVALGPSSIELHLSRLSSRRDCPCFDCVALKPNPARSNDSITHPHVQDRQLCAGEATVPIASALREGRICDAFCLVRSVLQTYNPASPYVPLDEWDGVTCGDCGHTCPRDSATWCEHCDQDCCEECISVCDSCDGSCCRGCLEADPEANSYLCPACRTTCSACRRVVDRSDVERDTGLCPQCREEQDENQDDEEQEDQDQENPPEDNKEQDHAESDQRVAEAGNTPQHDQPDHVLPDHLTVSPPAAE